MIRGVHTMFYSSQAGETRDFLRDVLGFSFTDVGDGWLIFDLPEADMGVHPADAREPHFRPGTHDVSFYCDDIRGTVAELRSKGVEFTAEVADHGYGLVTYFRIPGDIAVQLYQPHYVKRSQAAKKPVPRAKTLARKKRPIGKRPRPKKRAAAKKPSRRH